MVDIYVKQILSLPEGIMAHIVGYFDQQCVSRCMCAMTQMGESKEATAFRHYITKISKERSLLLRNVPGLNIHHMPDFHNKEPNFICLPKVPRSQISVGPRCIDNRPAWLTKKFSRDFVCIAQSRIPAVEWMDIEWGIPRPPLPPKPINADGWGRDPLLEAYIRRVRRRRTYAHGPRWGPPPSP